MYLIVWSALFLVSHYFSMKLVFLALNLVAIVAATFYFRENFLLLPLWFICMCAGRNFRVANKIDDIKKTLANRDKGRMLEELNTCSAFLPILSLESVNGPLWSRLRVNFMKFVEYLPSADKLGIIADEETKRLMDNKIEITSKVVSCTTLKVFLKYLFCEDHLPLDKNFSHDNVVDMKYDIQYDKNQGLTKNAFEFSDKFLTEEFLTNMFESSLEYRKEIAAKGKGNWAKKQRACDTMVEILNKSKYAPLLNWKDPECYSVVMQPFVISPMINLSDIASAVKTHWDKKDQFKITMDFIDFCIFNEHPFPVLERYEAKTNTMVFIDLTTLNKNPIYDGTPGAVNFGMGMRGCLGRVYARAFLTGFFEPYLKNNRLDLFNPQKGHLYSGRNNDAGNIYETLYTVYVILTIAASEFLRRFYRGNEDEDEKQKKR